MKRMMMLLSILSIPVLTDAADGSNQNNPYSGQYYDNYSGQYYDNSNRGNDPNAPNAQDGRVPTSNPRWYKSRSGRQEYLKGGTDYPRS